MSNILLPEKIRAVVGEDAWTQNHIGMSDSQVLVFSKYVLKIQESSEETENESAVVRWLNGRLPVPEIPAQVTENGLCYTLMTKITGKMLCTERYLNDPKTLIKLCAEGLRMLWSVDVSDCPAKAGSLENRLKTARYNVEHGLVDTENAEPETFGKGGFANPEALLYWLESNQPTVEPTLTHGDFCLPNVFAENGGVTGFIDLGRMEAADRWQDIAICMRSLKANLGGRYSGGRVYADFEPQMLLDEFGIEMDAEKNRYYLLLDELF